MRILDSSPWRQKTLIVEKHSKRRGNQQNVHTLLRHRRHVAPTLGSPTLLRGRLGKDVEVHVSHSLHSLFLKKIFKTFFSKNQEAIFNFVWRGREEAAGRGGDVYAAWFTPEGCGREGCECGRVTADEEGMEADDD